MDDSHICNSCLNENELFGYNCNVCERTAICSKCCYACYCQSSSCICKICFETKFSLYCDKCNRQVDPKISIGSGFGEHGFCIDGGDYLCCGCDVDDDMQHTDTRCTGMKCDGIITLEKLNKKIKK
jgi:hypothetical protein